MKKTLVAFSILFLNLFTNQALAGSSYWGIGGGSSSFDLKPFFGSDTLEDSTALRFVFGALQYDSGYELDVSVADYDWTNTPSSSHTAVNVIMSAAKYVSINDSVKLFGKIGVNFWSTDVTVLGGLYEGDDGIGIAASTGIDFEISEDFHFSAEYQVLPGLSDGLDDGDINQLLFTAIFYH